MAESAQPLESGAHVPDADFLKRLARILPERALILDAARRRVYECDGLTAYRELPYVVAIPESLAQLREIVRLCHDACVPVVARGAGTGLSGGALPHAHGVLLSLAKFNRILEIDALNRTARVEPGVRNLAISEAAAPHGLYYAPDPSSQIACTIGGNVAENAGGVHCLKYGLTVHNVCGLQLLLADGEEITLGGQALDTPGYDLLAVLNGSEGMLGIVTEITVRLRPRPERAQVVLAAFGAVEKAADAVATLIGAGIIPAGLEMMDNVAIRAAEDYAHAGYPTEAAAILLCELDGMNEEVSDEIAHVRELLLRHGATSVRTAADDAERLRLWAGRKAAFPAVGRLAPDYYCMDGTIQRRTLAGVLRRIARLSSDFGLPIANVFHAGDGNLHPLILYDANKPGDLEKAEAFGAKILEACIAAGGTITGEHGVGVEKLDQMCAQFGAMELSQFHALKNAFDPSGLLNPGKAVPTLHRCAEFGRMHVHRGELPFADLPRF